MSVIICLPPELATSQEFDDTQAALRWAEQHFDKLEPSLKGYVVLKIHSKPFHITQVTKNRIEFVGEVK